MTRRTVTVTMVRYWPQRARGEGKALDLGALPDGTDFLDFTREVWDKANTTVLSDRTKDAYCRPGHHDLDRRTLLMRAAVGSYGDPGLVVNVGTGKVTAEHEGELTNAIPQRLFLASPARGTAALLFIEHIPGGVLGRTFLDELKRAWSQRFPKFTLDTVTVVRPKAWLDAVELDEITASIHGYSANLEDAGKPGVVVGTIKSTLRAEHGHLPKRMLAALRSHDVSKAQLLGLREEPDEVKVTVTDGVQQKTYVLGKERTPSLRYIVTDWGDASKTDDEHRAWCLDLVPTLLRDVGVDWHNQ